MHDSYVDGFCLKLENILDREKIKEVANLLFRSGKINQEQYNTFVRML